MRSAFRVCLRALLAGCALALIATASYATVTFLGCEGASSTGRCVVGWTNSAGTDSTVATFGLTPGTLYAGTTFSNDIGHSDPETYVTLSAWSDLTIAPAGVADSTAPVASGTVTVSDNGVLGARWVQATGDFAIRYVADDPTVYWALVETQPAGPNPPPGPPGQLLLAHPPQLIGLTGGGFSQVTFAMMGAVMSGEPIEIGAILRAIRADGVPASWSYYDAMSVYLSNVPLTNLVNGVPAAERERVSLAAPGPNPAPGATRLAFSLPAAAYARLEILDVAGRHVRTLVDGALPAGTTSLRWDGADAGGNAVGAGVYFARLVAGADVRVRRVVLLR